MKKMSSFSNGQLSQSVLIAANDLILRNHLGSCQDVCCHLDRLLIDDKVPVFDCLLVKEFRDHLLDPSDLFLRINPCLSECFSHTWSLSDAIRHTIKKAEFSWKVVAFLSNLYEEHWLLNLSDFLVVAL